MTTENAIVVGSNNGAHHGGARVLLTDARVASLLLNEARDRTTARLFGVPREASSLLTVVAIGTLASALYDRVQAMLKVVPGAPSAGDTLIGVSAVNVVLREIAGSRAKETRFLATLLMSAVLAKSVAPALEASMRRARGQARKARSAFGRRYGGSASGAGAPPA